MLASGLIQVVPGLMIWTLIAFGITFFVLRRFAFGPIQRTIDERRDRIRTEIADLTLEATARVTGKVLDAEDQRRLIDEAIAELDFSALERAE